MNHSLVCVVVHDIVIDIIFHDERIQYFYYYFLNGIVYLNCFDFPYVYVQSFR